MAKTPCYDKLLQTQPWSLLNASEKEVGLPSGQIGNSEVGHMNLGAGRVVYQDIIMIDDAVEAGELPSRPALAEMVQKLQQTGGTCHLMGLVSPGGVHSMQSHIAALANCVAAAGVPVAIHAFTDGRDTPPKDAVNSIPDFTASLDGQNIQVATVTGRYWALDRDNRWDRVKTAFDAIAHGRGQAEANSPLEAVTQSYTKDTPDEFIAPTIIGGYNGMKDGDGVLMANFRADRAREILSAFVEPGFDEFDTGNVASLSAACGMVVYSEDLSKHVTAIFPPKDIRNTFGEVVSKSRLKQLRIAETEKYPHVTFFFNGGQETPFEGEDRILIPSPNVATYDLQPEMSAPTVTNNLVEAIGSGKYDVIIANFANPDMVGHTGSLEAAIKAVETIDTCLDKLVTALSSAKGTMLITADHGNVEQMRDPDTGQPHTAHTLNLVPFVLVNGPPGVSVQDGKLSDIAATMLNLIDIPKPEDMSGSSLLKLSA
eukprot:CAMPEP_0175130840 /NCGR_PEP_ID=MMETSP0087-20121206/6216_1 /TAXON_ID=136419 /ORGANISM="Unknown Unknown, Strain D1" /LENGTH=484 /DNA_ID=CAMNT_0016413075 /DNA_START=125 /DNA_END=1579 /DNA_ORIENTATION=+